MSKLPLVDRCYGALTLGPATASDLGKRVGVTTHTAYGAISALRSMGKIKPDARVLRTGKARGALQWEAA